MITFLRCFNVDLNIDLIQRDGRGHHCGTDRQHHGPPQPNCRPHDRGTQPLSLEVPSSRGRSKVTDHSKVKENSFTCSCRVRK